MSETTNATNYSIRSYLHHSTVQYQNKLALDPFDDKTMYFNPIKSLPCDNTQKGDCPCILCIKFIGLYYKELTEKCKTDEELYFYTWYCKQTLTNQQLLKLISDRAHLL